jgi:hypothetical protein
VDAPEKAIVTPDKESRFLLTREALALKIADG